MKILYVANIYLPSHKAHAVQIMKSCEAFARMGHEIELLIPRRKNSITEDPFSFYGIKTLFPIIRLSSFQLDWKGDFSFFTQSFSFAGASVLYALRQKYDVIYGRDESVLAAMITLLPSGKVAWETHTGSWNRCAQFVAARVPSIITISQGGKNEYVRKGIANESIFVAPSGVDLEIFSSPEEPLAARNRLGLSLEKKIVLYAGHLESWRGAETFFNAAMLLPSEYEVVVIGESPEIETLKRMYPKITFLGYRPYTELPHNLSAADILVLPNTAQTEISARFTSPLKLMAYMASGKPIISSDLPSIREIVTGKEVFFVEPDNSKALAQGIISLSENPSAAETLARNACIRVRKYDWNSRATNIAAFLITRISVRA